jgi:hypothetical protein
MEVADNQFQKIYSMVERLPVSSPTRILRKLSEFFYSHLAAWHDSEISHYFLSNIDQLYDKDDDILVRLQNFIDIKGRDIIRIASERPDIIFFSQPEIVVILERLENKPHLLIEYWEQKFPLDQLEYIANAWGKSLD